MQGSDFLIRRQADMRATFARHARLSEDLVALQGQGPFMRAYHMPRLTDPEIAQAAWGAFQPALPLNFAGALFGGAGFVLGAGLIGFVLRLLAWPLRRGRRAAG